MRSHAFGPRPGKGFGGATVEETRSAVIVQMDGRWNWTGPMIACTSITEIVKVDGFLVSAVDDIPRRKSITASHYS